MNLDFVFVLQREETFIFVFMIEVGHEEVAVTFV
jgi:hypothetical protein